MITYSKVHATQIYLRNACVPDQYGFYYCVKNKLASCSSATVLLILVLNPFNILI